MFTNYDGLADFDKVYKMRCDMHNIVSLLCHLKHVIYVSELRHPGCASL